MVFAGLQVILPLMGPQLLEYPVLANAYFSLLSSLCEIFPEKMSSIPGRVKKYFSGRKKSLIGNIGMRIMSNRQLK